MSDYVWVLEIFGGDGSRAVMQVFETDDAALDYMQPYGDFSTERRVANGQKQILCVPAEYPKSTFRFTKFEVKR